ncbi:MULTISPECIES: hypothetical protein [Ehrlichia]|uniref:Uncharacterized protein n=1 Tax=Ehrlichia cf. muris str. EmCRT TaxID=1359167 RepID=A0A0F3NCV4_9RICK|nr:MULTISPECIES: hypothetical protein [Ehrlichia]KJV65870.1 hypothetical protein EMUCRT_0051 [Ehrlichia cf. muris str. EmCRT]OUC04106.1 hypothetical protein DB91_04180 [Ehrlichia sp. Wisconsin_h]
MLAFLKKGADVFIKAAITPTTSKLPHQESVGKYLGGMIKSIIPGQQTPAERNFDLKMHNRTYKLGVELPGSTRTAGHESEVAIKIPSYKLPYQAIQKFAAWQEQDKQGDVEETRKDTSASLITPLSTAKELFKRKIADQHFEQLKALDNQLSKLGGKVTVDSTPGRYKQGLTIELDVSGKSIEDIEKDTKLVLESLGIYDRKLVKTFSQRLYKSCTDPKMSSADIQDKKTKHNTDSIEGSCTEEDVLSPTQEQSNEGQQTTNPKIQSSDFSLTNPKDMPYPKHPLQSSQMLQQLQNQILMQQKSDKMSLQSIPTTVQKEINGIVKDLSQGLSEDQIQSTSSKMDRQLTNPNSGKTHAR